MKTKKKKELEEVVEEAREPNDTLTTPEDVSGEQLNADLAAEQPEDTPVAGGELHNLTAEDVYKAQGRLREYKDYKKPNLEHRIRANEEWWRLRHWAITATEEERKDKHMAEPVSAWLHNSINNKHADIMDNYPEPMVLPRESSDDPAAKT